MEKNHSKRNENKSFKRTLIIDTAEKLFLENDYESTTMDEIASKAELTKRTIYQYFISKEDLFYAVVLKWQRFVFSLCEEAIENGTTALEKIRLINMVYCNLYIDNPGIFRIINYQPDNMLNCKASPSYQEVETVKDAMLRNYSDIINEGRSDGSINKNLDIKKAVYFGLLSSIGLLNQVSMLNKSYLWQGDIVNEKDFLFFSMELLADALK